MASSPLPKLRRVVTGHNAAGDSVVLRDGLLSPGPGGAALFRTDVVPVHNDSELKRGEWADAAAHTSERIVPRGGSESRVFDMAPESSISLHRTHSLDIAILLKGSISLLLDNGEKVVLKEGDTLLQRGTRHGWKNESASEWTRIMFVLLDAHPVEVSGAALPEYMPG